MAFKTPGNTTVTSATTEWARSNQPAPAQLTEQRWLYPNNIDTGRWNKLYPYILMVVNQLAGTYIPRPSDTPASSWAFSLPIPPEALRISMPFAIATTVTLGGSVEEHSGSPIRMISLSGTTGVFPGRVQAPAAPDFSNYNGLQSIFTGTFAAASQTSASANTFLQGRSFATNAVDQSTFDNVDDNGALTGYYQMRLLELFLESYAELKRTPAGRNARLAFCVFKKEQIWLCTPVSFDVDQTAQAGWQYNYSLQLKATKRIKLSTGAADVVKTYTPLQRDPGKLAKFLDKVQQARVVLQNARTTIAAVGGDVDHSLFQPMRELTLFAKDALSVPLAVADLGDALIQDTRDAVINLIQTGSDIAFFTRNAAARGQEVSQDAVDTEEQVQALAAETFSDNNAPPSRYESRSSHPGNDPFLFPTDNYGYFSLINIGDLSLAPALVAQIARERNRIRRLTRLDFQNRRDMISQTATAFSNSVGAGSANYNAIYGISPPTTKIIDTPTDQDWEVIFAMNALVIEIDRLVVTNDTDPNPKLDSISTVAGLAQRSGIAFQIPVSKFSVPFPYGATLESLSNQYLGDPLRFHEIVALNGLQTPYVDEEGFKLPLLVSGAGNSILVSDDTHLFTGQPVWIESVGVTRTSRRITGITKLSTTEFLVTVDGDSNLDQYTTMANAFLQAFLPGTVNSQMTIFIPSQIEPKDTEGFITKSIPGVDYTDPYLAVGGIDFLLTPKNDLVITPDGSVPWAVGLQRIQQAVRLALMSVRGKLLGHNDYGLPLSIGESLADVNATDLTRALNDLFNGDPTFAGVRGAHVTVNGPVVQIGLGVLIQGQSQVIPISSSLSQ